MQPLLPLGRAFLSNHSEKVHPSRTMTHEPKTTHASTHPNGTD